LRVWTTRHVDPALTGEKVSFYLDKEKPLPSVWNMLKEHNLIRIYDF